MKNVIKCNVCGHEQEKGLTCSKCGSKIRVNPYYTNKFKTNPNKRHDYRHVLTESSSMNLFERIQWNGVTAGIIFYIIVSIVITMAGGLLGYGTHIIVMQDVNAASLFFVISGIAKLFGLISALIPIASGFWAVYNITTRDYVTGIVTGGMVGVIIGILFGILSLTVGLLFSGFYGQINIGAGIISGLMVLITSTIYGGAITAAGGLIAVYVRKHSSYI